MAPHRAVQIAEILSMIFGFLEGQNASLACCARVSQQFLGPALDVLWRSLTSQGPIDALGSLVKNHYKDLNLPAPPPVCYFYFPCESTCCEQSHRDSASSPTKSGFGSTSMRNAFADLVSEVILNSMDVSFITNSASYDHIFSLSQTSGRCI